MRSVFFLFLFFVVIWSADVKNAESGHYSKMGEKHHARSLQLNEQRKSEPTYLYMKQDMVSSVVVQFTVNAKMVSNVRMYIHNNIHTQKMRSLYCVSTAAVLCTQFSLQQQCTPHITAAMALQFIC